MLVLTLILLHRVFTLQVVNGSDYLENFTLKIEKTRTIDGNRGNIFDKNGTLLASNELSYTITIEDNGSYDSSSEKNRLLNEEFATLIAMIEANGDEIANDFCIIPDGYGGYKFTVEGTQLMRFRADIFGRAKITDLKTKNNSGINEQTATAQEIVDYLCQKNMYDIRLEGTEDQYTTKKETDYSLIDKLLGRDKEPVETVSNEPEYHYYDADIRYKIMVLRYALSQNAYQKYISATVAEDVSEETVAVVKEHMDELQGVEVVEDTKRVYHNAAYFSHILGYTGKISAEELETYKETDDSYDATDIVGKAGIEQVMESVLRGTKGEETVYVDNLGKVLEVKEYVESTSGNDVYLSIDAELQMAVYQLLEQELAGIVYAQLSDVKTTSDNETSNAVIPIYDVYTALIENNVIDSSRFPTADPTSVQADIYQDFVQRKAVVFPSVEQQLLSTTPYGQLSTEMQDYLMYIIEELQDTGVFDAGAVKSSDPVYTSWKNNEISVREYLEHAMAEEWIDITYFDIESKYANSEELYQSLVSYILLILEEDTQFLNLIYKYLIMDDVISGKQLCYILYEQGVLNAEGDSDYENLKAGVINSYTFLKNKIRNIEITPAQLALNPCSGSCVITDPNTGELLVCVSYPGYDNNKLANTMDTAYYNKIYNDKSLPMYNYATQQLTAPGSTFKMISAAAGLTEGIITVDTIIETKGAFEKLTPSPKCWIHPSNHGNINVVGAICDSCNYFFYDIGWNLSMEGETYNGDKGVEALAKYAAYFGLGEKTGVEITESSPKIATELPVPMAIGQSNNNFSTIGLARYVAAVANSGTVYNFTLLSKVTDSDGNVLDTYSPTVNNEITEISSSSWDAIHLGMKQVVETHDQFDGITVESAGKTGTAQQANMPNHALFVGYAPYSNPEISLAVRIANGYTSGNAADLAASIYKYYFNLEDKETLLSGVAENVGSMSNTMND
ncbi:MAG: peptidoglycan glycosyltransferase [Eubacterium sp.]|nr:peptidoglycan glycosyltransferase [Eubacterium sp.]